MRRGGRGPAAGERSVAARILSLLAALVLVLVVVATVLAVVDARRDARDVARSQALATAWAVAGAPSVRDALADSDPSRRIQPYAERVRRDTGVDFVVVMDLDRTRFSHPMPDLIGESFVGGLGGAPEGRAFTQQYEGTLGPSERAVVPVVDGSRPDGGSVIALVSAGVTLEKVDAGLRGELAWVLAAAVAVLGLGYAGAWGVVRRLRRDTHGLGPGEIARIYEYHQAVLHAVREGLLLLDARGVVQLANDEAQRLLGLPGAVAGRRLDDLGLPPSLVSAVGAGADEHDAVHVVGDHVLVVSATPAVARGREVGSVVTLRDRTELQETMGELDTVRGLTDSLRAQQHEAANRLHTVVSLIETGRTAQAVEFATGELHVVRRLTDDVLAAAGEPVLGALLLAKLSQAEERGITLTLHGALPAREDLPTRDLVTVVGNLIDNALEAVEAVEAVEARSTSLPAGGAVREVSCHLDGDEEGLVVTVGDSGDGTGGRDLADLQVRGVTTKGAADGRGIGLALVTQAVRRHGGEITLGVSDLGGAEFQVEIPLAGVRTVRS
ncbi:sensor histidine kinase [Nocardioidaceae bacterium]|nr:sensor histidine kinase [Nocardioidaceae bacterium]